jgi:mannose/fructose/N-acetylgalactosamine-specific phosphotransferase system component IIB
MGIVMFRIDDRLIHGQVVEGWFHTLHPDRIVVADDEAAENAFQKSLMKLAVPYGVVTEVLTIQNAVQRFQEHDFLSSRSIVLFRLPRDVLTALDLGLSIDRLNLGGLHAAGKTKILGKGVLASEQDLHDLEEILQSGIHVEVRPVPTESSVDLRRLM